MICNECAIYVENLTRAKNAQCTFEPRPFPPVKSIFSISTSHGRIPIIRDVYMSHHHDAESIQYFTVDNET
jgi:hypothetical protein